MKKTLSLLCASWLLGACASQECLPKLQALPSEHSSHWFQVEQLGEQGQVVQTSLLAVQPEQGAVRFVQTDPLGVPVSRQVLSEKGWANDGFVAPNRHARTLFAAVLPLLGAHYAVQPNAQGVYQLHGKALWQTRFLDGQYTISLPNGIRWHVKPIEE